MRRLLPLFLSCIFCTIALPVFSDILVIYRSGECSVDLYGTGNWKDAEVDMELEMQSVIRTAADGSVEIDLDGEIISIGGDRFTSVGELLGKVEQRKKVGFLKGLKKYTRQMGAGEGAYTDTALAGVRGASRDEEELEWFDDEDAESETTGLENGYSRGMAHFDRGEYTAAAEVFENLVDAYGADALDGAVSYHLGISLFHVMRFDEAAEYLEMSIQERDPPFYDVALMHLAVSRYFLHDYNSAIIDFLYFTAKEENGNEMRPYALLMIGKCYKEQGYAKQAAGFFTEVKDRYRGTEFSDAAEEELSALSL
jgi:TolA-binding protein